ncbi:MAG: glycosyltransferase [Arcobacter sp.]
MAEMKILHVTNAYPYEGWPIYGIFVKEQVDSLNTLVDVNDVYFINGKKYGKKEYILSILQLRKLLSKYDIVHAHHIYVGFILLFFFKKYNIIVSLMSDPERKTGGIFTNFIYKLSYQYCLKHAKALIYKKEIPKNNSHKSAYYQPNGVNMEIFHEIPENIAKEYLHLDMKKKYILFVSSNNINRKEKRHDRFLSVLQLLRDKYLMNDIEPLYMINVKREDIPYYFNAASLHLLVSDVEGSPNSVKESLACNTPVVSTDVGNVKELLKDLQNCYVSNTFNAEDIAKHVHSSLVSTKIDLRNQLVRLNLDHKNVANNLLKIYQKVISK